MRVLPIAERELSLAARRRSTFWLRVVAALVGLLIGSGVLLISKVSGFGTAEFGGVLFAIVTWLCLGTALSAGLFFTSDCLSEEKREGTLGLLFLTDLRGYDVVLGKLLATSVRGFFPLLAVFPILAITFLMGGVTGPQFWKTLLALANALLCSLAAGCLVSAVSRDSQRAIGGTLVLLLCLIFGGPIVDAVREHLKGSGFRPLFCNTSPAYAFLLASEWGGTHYWLALRISGAISCAMLWVACVLVPRTWQERANNSASASKHWAYESKFGTQKQRARLRHKLLELDPVLWLVCRERWQFLVLWLLAIVCLAAFVLLVSNSPRQAWMFWSYTGWFFAMLFYLATASQACRFLIQARRTGLLELLLAAPLSVRQIVRGHSRALLRLFGLPTLLILAMYSVASGLSQAGWGSLASQASAAMATAASATNSASAVGTTNGISVVSTNVAGSLNARSTTGTTANTTFVSVAVPPKTGPAPLGLPILVAALAGLSFAGNLLALTWFGMWMGLTSKNANLSTLRTIAFVQVIPSFAFYFLSSMASAVMMAGAFMGGTSTQATRFLYWYPLLSTALVAMLHLAKDAVFVAWSRRKLYGSFREQLVAQASPLRPAIPPPLPGNRGIV